MKTRTKKLLTGIKYLFDFLWYLTILLAIVTIAIEVIGGIGGNNSFTINGDYKGKLSEKYETFAGDDVTFTPTEGEWNFSESNRNFKPSYFLYKLFDMAAFLFILYYMRRFFTVVIKESPFSLLAIKSLRLISVGLVAMNVIYWFYKYYVINSLLLHVKNVTFGVHVAFPSDFYYILAAIWVYILSEIFKYGYELQQENKEFV